MNQIIMWIMAVGAVLGGVDRIARVFVVVFWVGHGVLQGERFASGRA